MTPKVDLYKTSKTNIENGKGVQNTFSFTDVDMTKNGSIWNKVGSSVNTEEKQYGMTESEIEQGKTDAKNAKSDAESANAKKGGLVQAYQGALSSGTKAYKSAEENGKRAENETKNFFSNFTKEENQITKTKTQADKVDAELTSLIEEAAMLSETENGEQTKSVAPAVSQGNQKASGLLGGSSSLLSSNTQNTSGGASSSRLAQINALIEAKGAEKADLYSGIAKSVEKMSKNSDKTFKSINTAAKQAKESAEIAQKATDVATTAATAFGGIAAVGKVVKTIAKPLIPVPPTTAPGTAANISGEITDVAGTTGNIASTNVATNVSKLGKILTSLQTKYGATAKKVFEAAEKVTKFAEWGTNATNVATKGIALSQKNKG